MKEKQKKIKELSDSIEIYLCTDLSSKQISKATDLRNRLEFRLKELERQGMDEKIEIMEELLNVLKDEKPNNKKNT
ncbi:MAG: hypothetical protein PF549_02715 [Patescibacteria group bacterium]|jgi:hypothetical protein|nr:hypothetical protein [Patescibacteria group bacterium]